MSIWHSRFTRLYSTSAADASAGAGKLRVLFCGSDEFSVRNLDKLLAARDVWKEVHILTPRLRKSPIPLLDYARTNDLPTSQVPHEGIKAYTIPSAFDAQPPSRENVLVTASFGHIIPDSFLSHFDLRTRLNVHPSLLPHYRGAAPIQWTIANADEKTGVSVQRLVERGKGIDGGEIVGSVGDIDVAEGVTYRSLLDQLAERGGDLLVDVLRKIQAGTDEGVPQDPSQVTRAPKITHDTARIRWTHQSALEIDRLSRGIAHQYPLWTTLNGISIQLFDPKPYEGSNVASPGTARLLRKQGKLIVACSEGTWVQVERVKSQGKKEVGVSDWWNGLPKGVREGKEVVFE